MQEKKYNDNTIFNSLKRLERMGKEDSQTIQKIKDAAKFAGDYIVEHGFIDRLPGYTFYGKTLVDPHGRSLGLDMSRDAALDFARDVAETGIIGDVVDENGRAREGAEN